MRDMASSARVAPLAARIAALAARVEVILAEQSDELGHDKALRDSAPDPKPDQIPVPGSDRIDAADDVEAGAYLRDRLAYLESALAQRSAEAEEWMASDRSARQYLLAAEGELAAARAALLQERSDRSRAEKNASRLAEEIELLTRLLGEVEEREADRRRVLEADVATARASAQESRRDLEDRARHILDLEARIEVMVTEAETWQRDRSRVEKGLAEERLRTDQYRDVAQRMQTLCTYQHGEMALLREKVVNLESQVSDLQDARSTAEATAEKQRLAAQGLRQTLSWKATAPIRNLAKTLRRMLKAFQSSRQTGAH
jgi:chromosome segregation ATPase